MLGGLVVVSALLAAPVSSFVGVNARKARSTRLHAGGPGYKIGAKTEGVLINNRFVVDELSKALPDGVEMSEVDLLRFALVHPEDEKAAEKALMHAIKWRQTDGKPIVDAAKEAVAKATAGGGWDNVPVSTLCYMAWYHVVFIISNIHILTFPIFVIHIYIVHRYVMLRHMVIS